MKPALIPPVILLFLPGCFGQGVRQVRELERVYGMPMREIMEKEKPKQIRERRAAGEIIEIEGENTDTSPRKQPFPVNKPQETWSNPGSAGKAR